MAIASWNMQTLPPVGVSGGTLLRHRAKMIWSFRCQLLRGAVISTTVTNILKRRVFTLYSYLQNTRTPIPSSHLDNSLMEYVLASPLASHQPCDAHAVPIIRTAIPPTPHHLSVTGKSVSPHSARRVDSSSIWSNWFHVCIIVERF